jgi:hypothetical protein
MVVSHGTRSIFVHIQKTAGSSIEGALWTADPAIESHLRDGRRHQFAREVRATLAPEVWRDYFKFAFVRNPWDRLVSWYAMCKRNPGSNKFSAYVNAVAPTFEDFVTKATTGMGVRTTCNQLDYVSDDDGAVIVDFVGRYERLDEDFAVVRERLRLPQGLPHLNQTPHGEYRGYYSAASRDIVARRFARDIAHFGYEF